MGRIGKQAAAPRPLLRGAALQTSNRSFESWAMHSCYIVLYHSMFFCSKNERHEIENTESHERYCKNCTRSRSRKRTRHHENPWVSQKRSTFHGGLPWIPSIAGECRSLLPGWSHSESNSPWSSSHWCDIHARMSRYSCSYPAAAWVWT